MVRYLVRLAAAVLLLMVTACQSTSPSKPSDYRAGSNDAYRMGNGGGGGGGM